MKTPKPRTFSRFGYTVTVFELPDKKIHREDGPAYTRSKSGERNEQWYYENVRHRYGGPAYIGTNGKPCEYWIHGNYENPAVEEWLSDMGYEWETMNEQEKWELELFMRSLG